MSGDPWKIDGAEFPHEGSSKEKIAFLLRYAILAPSTCNTQPWRFGVRGSSVDVYVDRSRWLKVVDPSRRELHMSVGCAVENLVIAAHHFGYMPIVEYFPNSDQETMVATVSLPPRGEAPENTVLFDALTRRATDYAAFAPRALEEEVLAHLKSCCLEEELALFLLTGEAARAKIQEQLGKANTLLHANPEYRAELGRWIGQGVFGTPWWVSKVGELAVTYLDFGSVTASKEAERASSAPAFGVIVAPVEDRAAQVRAGRLYERVALLSTHMGLGIQPMSQILETPETRAALTELLPEPDWLPQLPFRVGYATQEATHTPRRDLDEVLL